MEFKSTLERAKERYSTRIKQAEDAGYKEPLDILEVFNLIKDSASFTKARFRTIKVARDMQPSITNGDLRIASDMQLAMASELVLNLMREGLISPNRKEA